MEIHIGTKKVEESNEFLRCLWAEMEKEFGRCDWNYAPKKNGSKQRVFFGYMHINQDFSIAVMISYENKGSIHNLYFESTKKNLDIVKGTELYNRLKKVVKATRKKIGEYKELFIDAHIQSTSPIMPYTGENFEIKFINDKGFKMKFKINVYDEKHCGYQANKVINDVMDFLSVETDDIFWSVDEYDNYDELKFEETFIERDFMDENSLYWGYRTISKKGKQFLDLLTDCKRKDEEDLVLFLSACNHFHTARMQEEQIYKKYEDSLYERIGISQSEIATTMYLSALEVISLIGFKEEKCGSCGQVKYQISKRISQIAYRYLPSGYVKELLDKQFIDFYEHRSKYLHMGRKLVSEIPIQYYVPQLNLYAENMCDFPHNIHLSYLRECVGHCLRSFYKDKFMKSIKIT
ncbi:hypothetical protein [Halalkalibacter alkalisediminis]|uniref:Apea-like HEPN domain-containing protein n=1 Tax=Halalkalibacter alkalisediminis TaxID=935616 RepID=A0ABV6NMI5_9BACI|nr:hypothetical protein [Halalkalibacter alkalisediminis]